MSKPRLASPDLHYITSISGSDGGSEACQGNERGKICALEFGRLSEEAALSATHLALRKATAGWR